MTNSYQERCLICIVAGIGESTVSEENGGTGNKTEMCSKVEGRITKICMGIDERLIRGVERSEVVVLGFESVDQRIVHLAWSGRDMVDPSGKTLPFFDTALDEGQLMMLTIRKLVLAFLTDI
jgi:hypothetical protein